MKQSKKNSEYFKLIYDHPSWNDIKSELEVLTTKQRIPAEIVRSLQQFTYYSYTHKQRNSKQQDRMSDFKALFTLYVQQLTGIFGDVAQVVLDFEKNPPKIPIMYSQISYEHQFLKSQVLLLMCMMALSLVSNQKSSYAGKFCWYNSFSYIFSTNKYKTKTVVEYLKIQLQMYKYRNTKMIEQTEEQSTNNKQERLTIIRSVCKIPFSQILKINNRPMGFLKITDDNDSIENYYGTIKADFANKYIGGGSLTNGCVQEEIMFANHPELYVSMLFSEVMNENESIFFIGFKKYFKNKGYGYTTSYDGYEEVVYEYDQNNHAKEYITAIDAINFPYSHDKSQFSKDLIDRELYKAYVGFKPNFEKSNQVKKVVTGNWGCGAFNGNIQLKLLIQWIACSLADKQMIYTPFGYHHNLAKYSYLFEFIKETKISPQKLYMTLVQQAENVNKNYNILDLLEKKYRIQNKKQEKHKL